MPRHLYPSESFEQRFRWNDGRTPDADLRSALEQAATSGETTSLLATDVKGRSVELRCEALDTPSPWWRVVRADGSLAAGADQEARLRAEGVRFRAGDPPRVDLRAI